MMRKLYMLCLLTGLLIFGSRTAGELSDMQVVEAKEAGTVAASEAVTVSNEDLTNQKEHMEEMIASLKAREEKLKTQMEAGDDTADLEKEFQTVQAKQQILLANLEAL